MVFLDAASTTYPLYTRETLQTPQGYSWFNANTSYATQTKSTLRCCENIIKSSIGIEEGSVYFIGNATQCYKAFRQAVFNAEDIYDDGWYYLLKSPYEHSCVMGGYVENLDKLTDVDFLKKIQPEGKLFVICQLVNNLTGDIFPVKEIAEAVHKTHNFLICDATAAVGKIVIDYDLIENCDAIFCSSHKFHGEKNQGFLWVCNRLKDELIDSIEYIGTPDVQGACATAVAFEKCNKTSDTDWDSVFEENLDKYGIKYKNISIKELAKYTTSIGCWYLPDITSADALQMYLADRDIYIGVGHSSCEDNENRYRVLNAIGLSDEEAAKCIRLSFDGDKTPTTEQEIVELCDGIHDFIKSFCGDVK